MKNAFNLIRAAIAWRWWVLGYQLTDVRQRFRSALKQFIMRAVDRAQAFGEWLVRVLRLGDC